MAFWACKHYYIYDEPLVKNRMTIKSLWPGWMEMNIFRVGDCVTAMRCFSAFRWSHASLGFIDSLVVDEGDHLIILTQDLDGWLDVVHMNGQRVWVAMGTAFDCLELMR